tara:strand:- start:428 stop:859 length:432 start_codon:yes stop_codon:yes gene_type:complete
MDTHTQNDQNNPINYKESPEDRAAAKNELIKDTLQGLTIKYLNDDALDYLSCSEELGHKDSNEIFGDLAESGYFDVEIIYYHKAIDYLKEYDTSLSESIEIAYEMGFTLENLNSESLASLHASRKKEEDFWEYVAPELDKINN